jgi:Asp-tRNA(Asn)/Glu-tRNA(Gln) amidotransferase A subunit family amidase
MSNFASKFSHKRSSFLAYTRIMSVVADTLEARDYIRAQQVRTRMMNHLSRYFKDQGIDLILTPTTAILSPIIPEKAMSYGMMNSKLTVSSMVYAVLANLTGIPAVNIPVGYHNDLPIGLQFMASWWNEALLCRIAKAIERLPTVERERPKEHWFADNIL